MALLGKLMLHRDGCSSLTADIVGRSKVEELMTASGILLPNRLLGRVCSVTVEIGPFWKFDVRQLMGVLRTVSRTAATAESVTVFGRRPRHVWVHADREPASENRQ